MQKRAVRPDFKKDHIDYQDIKRRMKTVQSRKIIQCPSCQTKFAVRNTAIQKQSPLRFHCSRCDNIFNIDQETLTTSPAVENKLTENGREENKTEEKTPVKNFTASAPVRPRRKKKQQALGLGAPHENRSSTTQESEENQIAFSFPPATHRKEINTDSTSDEKAFTQASLSDETPDSTDDQFYREEGMQESFFEEPPAPAPEVQKNTPYKDIMYIAAPVLICLLAIIISSSVIERTPEGSKSAIEGMFSSLKQVPPAGLTLKDLRFKKVSLDNGETVELISGRIINGTNSSWNQVTLEGMGFDNEGNIITRLQVNASTPLAKSRIKSLSRSMIASLQEQAEGRRLDLLPENEHDFVIAFPENHLKEASHYSARVYSAETRD